MTNKQKEIIKDNLNAYIANFGYIKIVPEDYGKGFYIFTDKQRAEAGSWTQYVIILADSEMQLIKALTEKHTNYTGYERINNIQADTMQREGVHTFIIETV